LDRAVVQAIACEVIFESERPLSRQSLADLTGRARTALERPISRATVWRILHTAALKPWRFEYWIFPRDPKFVEKAEVILDLYAGYWQGTPLTAKDCIVSSDEKTSIQARLRCHPGLPPAPGRSRRVEFEYDRGGALQYLAGWDVRRGYVSGRCEPHTGIEPFGRLVDQVMAQEPRALKVSKWPFSRLFRDFTCRGDTSRGRVVQKPTRNRSFWHLQSPGFLIPRQQVAGESEAEGAKQ
jgi:hypothetical protein